MGDVIEEGSVRSAPPGTQKESNGVYGIVLLGLTAIGAGVIMAHSWISTMGPGRPPRELPPFSENQIVKMKLGDHPVMVIGTRYIGKEWRCTIRYQLTTSEYVSNEVSCWELEVRGPSE